MRISDWSSDVCSSDLFEAQQSGASRDQPLRFDIMERCSIDSVQRLVVIIAHDVKLGATFIGAGFNERIAGIPLNVRAFQCRSEEHTSELQSLMRISYAVFCLKKKKNH